MECNLNDCLSTIIKVWNESEYQQLRPETFLPQIQACNHARTHEQAKSFVVDAQYKPPKQFDMSAYQTALKFKLIKELTVCIITSIAKLWHS